jgi:glycosyltransferase involved in cell wall biosynthesis
MSGDTLRVLHVIEAMDQGGAESLVVEHVRHAGPGVEVLVCALNRGGPALEAARAAGAGVFVLAGRGRLARIGRLARLLREEGVEVVNGHNPTGGLVAALAARRAGLHAVLRTEHSLHYPGRHSRLYPLLERVATALTRRVVCVCETVRESHASRFPRAARRFVTVRNGVSAASPARPRAAVRAALGLGPEERVAVTVGSLTPQKAQHVLLEAFARVSADLPASRLLVVGEGPLRSTLEARRDALGLGERVWFLGARTDVGDLLTAADVFTLSSRREGLPVTLLEAMRGGCAAVVTRAGGCAEAVVEGTTGRLVPVDAAPALGAALAALLADPEGCARMGREASARWAREFTAERMVRETEAVYAAALGETRGGRAGAGARK